MSVAALDGERGDGSWLTALVMAIGVITIQQGVAIVLLGLLKSAASLLGLDISTWFESVPGLVRFLVTLVMMVGLFSVAITISEFLGPGLYIVGSLAPSVWAAAWLGRSLAPVRAISNFIDQLME